jgi:hypothetical protein
MKNVFVTGQIKSDGESFSNHVVNKEVMSVWLFIFLLFGLRGYWHCGHSCPTVPASGDSEDDCGEADGM